MKILMATDGSDTARAAVDFLAAFPLPPGTEVTVITVLKEVLAGDELQRLSAEHRQAFEQARASETAEAQQLLDGDVARLRAAGLTANSMLCTGHPPEEIVRLATELHSDIITVGSHGLSGFKRFLLGSVSDRVFEYAPCSVLIVKQAHAGGTDSAIPRQPGNWRLLLAFDDSPPARKAVELCAALPLPEDTAIKAITVLPLIRMYRQDIRQHLSWVWQEKKRAAELALQWLAAEVNWKQVKVTTQLLEHTDVAQAILDGAAEFDSELIVVGQKGRKTVERFLRGSVTARVAHHAACSVLSVRDGQ
jgi:nucleotide-binding universal stress UspA family protein